ncbi:hypothetical protein VTG60DRAFT_4976 [Thermothelomyces hinnuleus]
MSESLLQRSLARPFFSTISPSAHISRPEFQTMSFLQMITFSPRSLPLRLSRHPEVPDGCLSRQPGVSSPPLPRVRPRPTCTCHCGCQSFSSVTANSAGSHRQYRPLSLSKSVVTMSKWSSCFGKQHFITTTISPSTLNSSTESP